MRHFDIGRAYEACAPAAFRRARRLLDDEDEAWDVVHEVFEKMVRNPPSSHAGMEAMRYVYRATTHACINRWKRRGIRSDESIAEGLKMVAAPAQSPEAMTTARSVLAAIGEQLDETEQQIVVLHYIDGLSQAQTAQVLGVWRRTIGRRIRNIEKKVRALDDSRGERSCSQE